MGKPAFFQLRQSKGLCEIGQRHIQEGEGVFKHEVPVFEMQGFVPCGHDIVHFQVQLVKGVNHKTTMKAFLIMKANV